MQYHALSLLQNGYEVSLLGYKGETLISALQINNNNNNVDQSLLHVIRFQPSTPWKFIRERLKLLYYFIRFVELVRVLCHALFIQLSSSDIDCVLVQNPPSVPLLLIAFLFCRIYGAGLVIDWHNLGYTMMEGMTDRHPIRRFMYWYEKYMSHLADGHLCVTKAMEEFLHQSFQLKESNTRIIRVLYDRPPIFFRRTTSSERVDLMNRLSIASHNEKQQSLPLPSTFPAKDLALPKEERKTVLLMSCTSWTPDEDFKVLLDALEKLDQRVTANSTTGGFDFPKVAVVVTGKGPQKSMYQNKILRMRPSLTNITIDTMWLEASDYPMLLGCADLGICLHTSTSGRDLPIKIMDMFGCQVPVCAIQFQCIEEVMRHGWNGMIFTSSDDLTQQLLDLLGGERGPLESMRNNIATMARWDEEWNKVANEVIHDVCIIGQKRRFVNGRRFER